MNLRDNRGFVGVDISIAVIILLVLVPTIMGIIFFINSLQNVTKVKDGALNIATNAMELAKGIDLRQQDTENLTAYKINENEILDGLMQIYNDSNNNSSMTVDSENEKSEAVITFNDVLYKLEISVTDFANNTTEQNIESGIVKTATVSVTYKVRGEEKTMNISTVVK